MALSQFTAPVSDMVQDNHRLSHFPVHTQKVTAWEMHVWSELAASTVPVAAKLLVMYTAFGVLGAYHFPHLQEKLLSSMTNPKLPSLIVGGNRYARGQFRLY